MVSQYFHAIIIFFDKIRRNYIPCSRKVFFLFSRRKAIRNTFLQRRELVLQPPREGAKLVLLVFPAGVMSISGGLFSILNIAMLSRKLLAKLGYKVFLAYPPGRYGLASYPYFPNTEIIYTFEQIMRLFPSPDHLVVHIPEYYSARIFKRAKSDEVRYLQSARRLQINILNQNILLMPAPELLNHLKKLTPDVTQTTAHSAYTTPQHATAWGTPLLHLAPIFWREYPFVPWAEKRNWIAYSPDVNPHARMILATLRSNFPDFRFIRISGVSYEQYLNIISKSKYVISFGEGWDGYFWEAHLCGTIGCAVHNTAFFPKNFKGFPTVYTSFAHMNRQLPEDIRQYENGMYMQYIHAKYAILHPNIERSWNRFEKSLMDFYQQRYDFYPTPV